jgi:hypothetical protein
VAAAPAAPRFFADTVLFAEGSGPLQVRESATGALVAQDEHTSGVTGLAGAGVRSFVIALPVSGTCATRLYRLRLSRRGLPGRLSPLGHELHGELWSLAASASGQVIGYAISGCAKGEPGYIGVTHVRGGRTRQWGNVNLGGVSPGNVALGGALSMSANGALIAFTGWDLAPGGRATRQVVRVLPASAPMGLDPTGHFLLVPYSLRSPHNPAGRAALLAARIDIAARATAILDLSPPASTGMDPYVGLRTAW